MKKLIISLGLALLLITPVYADTHDEAPNTGSSTDAAGAEIPPEAEEDVVNISNDNQILIECSAWITFSKEKKQNNRPSCEEDILSQIENGNQNPFHGLYNPNGENSINGANGCCYDNRQTTDFDENNDCKLDTNAELCLLNQRELEIKKSCICAEDPTNPICSQVFRCQIGKSSPTAYTTEGVVPYESEFFDVTNPNKGLLAEDQSGSLVADSNSQEGPIFTLINRGLNIMVGLASTAALVVLIIGAYMLITAQGGENQMEKGKNAIIYSLLGLVFILTSYTIVRLVQSILF